MHVHLVFVTKYCDRGFDGKAVASLRMIFAKLCTDFETTQGERDGTEKTTTSIC
jgi:putative transposase